MQDGPAVPEPATERRCSPTKRDDPHPPQHGDQLKSRLFFCTVDVRLKTFFHCPYFLLTMSDFTQIGVLRFKKL